MFMRSLEHIPVYLLFLACLMWIGACTTNRAEEPEKILYEVGDLGIYADSITEGTFHAFAADDHQLFINDSLARSIDDPGIPALKTGSSLINFLFHMACHDLHRLYREEGYFVAGLNNHFNTWLIYTRDISYSSYLGLAYLMPDEVINHLRYTRKLRMNVGFRHSRGHEIPLPSVPNQLVDLPEGEFKKMFGSNSVSRRTDDIVWVPGWYQCWLVLRDDRLLTEMVETFEAFDSAFYRHYYDPADGLYSGQASFIDIGGSGYPEELRKQRQMCTVIKSLSTNALYYGAFRHLQEACRILGMEERSEDFGQRADELGENIRTRFYQPDGYYAYFIHPDGRLEPRVEQLGSSFMTLFGIVPHEDSCRNLEILERNRNRYGAQVIYPFYDNSSVYHNNSVWPFANMIFDRARAACGQTGRDTIFYQALASLARHAFKGSFHELTRYHDGEIRGSPVYIWSNAAFISFITDLLLGITIDEEGLTIDPFIPRELAGLSLDNFRIGDMVLHIDIEGHGDSVRKIFLNNERHRKPVIEIGAGAYNLRVVMGS